MLFQSRQEALLWAQGQSRTVVFYDCAVLDITHFAKNHPGGNAVFAPYLSKDIAAVFQDPLVHSHDPLSFDLLASLEVGRVGPGPLLRGDCFLNQKEALMVQVRRLTEEQYLGLLKRPHYFSQSVRLFELSFFEMFSKTEWKELFLIYPLVLALLLRCTLQAGDPSQGLGYLGTFLSSAVGLWVGIEYLLHQFLFHSESYGLCRFEWFRVFHFSLHGIHHVIPLDSYRIIFPPVMAIPILLLILALLDCLTVPPYGYCVAMGLVTGYLCYDLWHYSMHSFQHDLFQSHLRYHNRHHFSLKEGNYGVTTGFLDRVFRTSLPPT